MNKKLKHEWVILPGLALGVVLLSAYRRSLKPLGPILSRMRLRGQDQHGYGYFGASRSGGNRQHNVISHEKCTTNNHEKCTTASKLNRVIQMG
ncbi:hypothetical protein [Haliscomenobacter hydrossis]|uniref:hypothetical protein n=1 Tax=Haliscomenobacter hydrossis TaxID=2350 RepID=UPI00145E732A|nr:hypothetical protein [Haliscomenobacter hydrossis]